MNRMKESDRFLMRLMDLVLRRLKQDAPQMFSRDEHNGSDVGDGETTNGKLTATGVHALLLQFLVFVLGSILPEQTERIYHKDALYAIANNFSSTELFPTPDGISKRSIKRVLLNVIHVILFGGVFSMQPLEFHLEESSFKIQLLQGNKIRIVRLTPPRVAVQASDEMVATI